MSRRPYDVLLAGIGAGSPDNTTLATVRLLKQARVIYSLSIHTEWLRQWGPRVVDWDELYFRSEEAGQLYRDLAERVMEEAARRPGVALVDDGHPLLIDDVCADIQRRGRRRGLRVLVKPAISFFDALLTECDISLDADGFQVLEATSMVAHRQEVNPQLETFVVQLGYFGTSFVAPVTAHRRGRFLPLQRYLRRFFPAAHRVTVLRAPTLPKEKPFRLRTRLGQLDRSYRQIPFDSTLHIPARTGWEDHDEEFISRCDSWEHLAKIAELDPSAERSGD